MKLLSCMNGHVSFAGRSFISGGLLGLYLSLGIAVPAQASGLVGQILLVAGECPAGFLPADGRSISAAEYPELAAVLNEPTAVRFAQIDPVFLDDINPEPVDPPSPGGTLQSPIELVLYKTADAAGNATDFTLLVGFTGNYETTDPAYPSEIVPAVNAYLDKTQRSDKYPELLAAGYVIRTLNSDKLYDPDGGDITSVELSLPEYSWVAIDSAGDFVYNAAVVIDELLADYGAAKSDVGVGAGRTLVDSQTGVPTSFAPRYCVATGGDTAPLVEVGLEFVQGPGASGELVFKRVNVSGFPVVPQSFQSGDIDLSALEAANPGIKRPNITFRLVNENICRAYEEIGLPQRVEKSTVAKVNPDSVYPGELTMSGIQISTDTTSPKADVKWGDHFELQRMALLEGAAIEDSDFSYIAKRDELGRPGFVAADIVDERTIILENRNITNQEYLYRVQAQCGEGLTAYNVYFDPKMKMGGRGSTSTY